MVILQMKIEEHSKRNFILLVASIILFFCEILSLKLGLIPNDILGTYLGVFLVPPLFASYFFCLLWHKSWFKSKEANFLNSLKKIFFWFVAAAVLLAWISIYACFVF